LYASPIIIGRTNSRRMRLTGHVARMGEIWNAYNILVGKLEGKRPLGRPRRRWEDNVRVDLREIGWECMDWMHLAQDRDHWLPLVNTVMKSRFPADAVNILTSWATISFSRRTLLHGVSLVSQSVSQLVSYRCYLAARGGMYTPLHTLSKSNLCDFDVHLLANVIKLDVFCIRCPVLLRSISV
jgi:hypothetical protein